MDSDSDPPRAEGEVSSADNSSSGKRCGECGTRLSGGACPACALGFLLNGEAEPDPAAGELEAAEEVEFGRYTLKRRLAAGGMGVVYLAEDRKLKRVVALKMIRGSTFADDDEVARFTIEAEAAAALDHANIVPIYEVGRLDGQPFFTMKFIDGATLAQGLKEHGGVLPAGEVAVLMAKVARAVHHAHQRGVLHRDLKPANILIDTAGEPWLTDFGLAKVAGTDSTLTLTKDYIGTPHYMAPEVAAGNARSVSTASDVWALGVMLWEMLCGVPPFHGPGPAEIMRRIVESEPNWPAGTRANADLVTVARRCMEKSPARRPESAAAVADDLERWMRGEPIMARPVTGPERFMKWVRREPAMAALYAVLLCAFLSGLLLWQRAEHAVVSLTESKDRIQESLRVSMATKLAGDARLQVNDDPNRALLLAVEAMEMTGTRGALPEATSALISVLSKAGGLDASPRGLQGDYREGWVEFWDPSRLAFKPSPDGRWLLSTDLNNWQSRPVRAGIYDLHDWNQARPARLWDFAKLEISDNAWSWCWLPDSKRVLSVDGAGKVSITPAITAAMESGQVESGPPAGVVTCGTIPLPDGMQFAGLATVAAGTECAVTWVQHLPAESDADRAARAEKVRCGRSVVTPDGMRTVAERTFEGEWTRTFSRHISADGKWLIFGADAEDRQIQAIDLSGGEPVIHRLEMPPGKIRQVAFAAQGRRFALQTLAGLLCVGELPADGSPAGTIALRTIAPMAHLVWRTALSPDGRWMALGTNVTEVVVMDLNDPAAEPMHHYLTGGDGIAINFSPDSQWLAVGGRHRVVHLWKMDRIRTGTAPILLHGMPTAIGEVRFSRDASSVMAMGLGGVIRRWRFDGVTGAALPRCAAAGGGTVNRIAVSPDQQWMASGCSAAGDTNVRSRKAPLVVSRLDGSSRMIVGDFAWRVTSAAFSCDGRWLAAAGAESGVRVWDFAEVARRADAGEPPPEPRHVFVLPEVRTEFQWRLVFHPDGCLFKVNGDGKLFCWNLNEPEPDPQGRFLVIHSIKYLLPDVAISPDGKFLAAARQGWDGPEPGKVQWGSQVLLFDVSDTARPPEFLYALPADFLDNTTVSFSPDGRWLACGSAGSSPSLWDLKAPDIAASRLRAPVVAQLTAGVSFSPDSRRLAIGASDGQLYLWDWQNPVNFFAVQTGVSIHSTLWMPDGRILTAGGDDQVRIWDADPDRLKTLARYIAGRTLNAGERIRFRLE